MPKIHLLPASLRNKIAAGEVVERPASVVKELLENSIDAMSTRIEVHVLKAGKRLIRVSDNGVGMERDDAVLAFERYATSKINNEEDLFNIKTMGFRGEALSSIAAVSKVRLITGQTSGGIETGTCIEVIGGEIRDIRECPASGTTIEVKELFFNTPARLKFLKSDVTESYHIIDTVTREALSHFNIGFFLTIDGKEVLSLPQAGSFRERILQIFGGEFTDSLIEAEAKDSIHYAKFFLGSTADLRNNRNNQFIFINKRPVKDQSVTYAIYKGYEGMIPKDKHPVFFIFLDLEPSRVDFNVHPTKREVRFDDNKGVFNFVYQASWDALRQKRNGRNEETGHFGDERVAEVISADYVNPMPYDAAFISEPLALYGNATSESISPIYIGDTFLAFSDSRGLMIIDYHAAHERINYERLLKSQEQKDAFSYRPLFPQQIFLSALEHRSILENLDILNDLGLEIEDFGGNTLIVRSLPEFLKDADLKALMHDLAASLMKESKEKGMIEPVDSIKRTLASKIACHSSIRGKDVPDRFKISRLLKDLESTENPDFCPHGRPTRIFISIHELRRMFKK